MGTPSRRKNWDGEEEEEGSGEADCLSARNNVCVSDNVCVVMCVCDNVRMCVCVNVTKEERLPLFIAVSFVLARLPPLPFLMATSAPLRPHEAAVPNVPASRDAVPRPTQVCEKERRRKKRHERPLLSVLFH